MNSITNSIWHSLSAEQLHQAAALKGKIQSLENQLSKLLGSAEPTTKAAPKKRRKMSAAGKARIAAAQRKRWAKVKRTSKPAKTAKRRMSPQVRARISALARERWARARAAGRRRL